MKRERDCPRHSARVSPEGYEKLTMKLACLILSFAFAVSAFAASGKTVSYKSGDETVQGILYAPEGKSPFPALWSSTNIGD